MEQWRYVSECSVKALLWRWFRALSKLLGRGLVLCLKLIISHYPRQSCLIHVTYDANGKFDGLGAQAQRIIAIRGLASFLNVSYRQSQISQIAIHPLDGLSTPSDYTEYLGHVNNVFAFKDDCNCNSFEEKSIADFHYSHLIEILLRLLGGRSICFRITHPFEIVDLFPSIYEHVDLTSVTSKLEIFREDESKLDLVVHYRQGSGNPSANPLGRAIEHQRYQQTINKILLNSPQFRNRFSIMTDAPLGFLEFHPSKDQLIAWVGLPGFDGKTLQMYPLDSNSLFDQMDCEPSVISGGNPLVCLSILSSAKVLVMAKSSFSFVAALMNKEAIIYYPKEFWHPRVRSWVTY